jgi:hypothetical protein
LLPARARTTTTTAGDSVAVEDESKSTELDIWLEVLWTVILDDDSVYGENSVKDLYGAGQDDKQEDGMDEAEDSYEVAPPVLLPLPAVDDKKFPQEDKHYFKKKKYVRNDKYGLDKLLPEGMELPPLSSIYKL